VRCRGYANHDEHQVHRRDERPDGVADGVSGHGEEVTVSGDRGDGGAGDDLDVVVYARSPVPEIRGSESYRVTEESGPGSDRPSPIYCIHSPSTSSLYVDHMLSPRRSGNRPEAPRWEWT
jgi:hypothetical protein